MFVPHVAKTTEPIMTKQHVICRFFYSDISIVSGMCPFERLLPTKLFTLGIMARRKMSALGLEGKIYLI